MAKELLAKDAGYRGEVQGRAAAYCVLRPCRPLARATAARGPRTRFDRPARAQQREIHGGRSLQQEGQSRRPALEASRLQARLSKASYSDSCWQQIWQATARLATVSSLSLRPNRGGSRGQLCLLDDAPLTYCVSPSELMKK